MSSAYMLGVRNCSLHQFANHSELPWRGHLCMCIYVVEYLFWYHVSSIPCSWDICPGYLVFNFFPYRKYLSMQASVCNGPFSGDMFGGEGGTL